LFIIFVVFIVCDCFIVLIGFIVLPFKQNTCLSVLLFFYRFYHVYSVYIVVVLSFLFLLIVFNRVCRFSVSSFL